MSDSPSLEPQASSARSHGEADATEQCEGVPQAQQEYANDAAAICEAVMRPSMRFVATKSEQQQSILMLHRSRQLLVRQRTMLSNAIRGHMAEFGIVSAKGRNGTAELLAILANEQDDRFPIAARFSLDVLEHYREAHPCLAPNV